MPSKDELERRKRKDFPHVVTTEVMDDRAAWSVEIIRREHWCRERVGAGGYAKQGRMGIERPSLEFRFKSADVAADFQSTFGGEIGAEGAKAASRKTPPPSNDIPHDANARPPVTLDL